MNTPARIGKPAAVPPPYPGGASPPLSAAGEGKIQREPSHSRRSPAFPGKAAPHASSAGSIEKGGAPHRFALPFAISHHSVPYILYGIFLSQYIRDIRTPAAQALANMRDALPRKPWSSRKLCDYGSHDSPCPSCPLVCLAAIHERLEQQTAGKCAPRLLGRCCQGQ